MLRQSKKFQQTVFQVNWQLQFWNIYITCCLNSNNQKWKWTLSLVQENVSEYKKLQPAKGKKGNIPILMLSYFWWHHKKYPLWSSFPVLHLVRVVQGRLVQSYSELLKGKHTRVHFFIKFYFYCISLTFTGWHFSHSPGLIPLAFGDNLSILLKLAFKSALKLGVGSTFVCHSRIEVRAISPVVISI